VPLQKSSLCQRSAVPFRYRGSEKDHARGQGVSPTDGFTAERLESLDGFRLGENGRLAGLGDDWNEVGLLAKMGTEDVADRRDSELCNAPDRLAIQPLS
jgi:hypothetical protein